MIILGTTALVILFFGITQCIWGNKKRPPLGEHTTFIEEIHHSLDEDIAAWVHGDLKTNESPEINFVTIQYYKDGHKYLVRLKYNLPKKIFANNQIQNHPWQIERQTIYAYILHGKIKKDVTHIIKMLQGPHYDFYSSIENSDMMAVDLIPPPWDTLIIVDNLGIQHTLGPHQKLRWN